ncbi:MAG: hypothetical protein ACXWZM_01280 [Solirubrobacterales bacterium]
MNEQRKPPSSGGDAGQRPGPGPLAQNAAERLAVIIDAVEQAAAEVIDDAEAQAKEHLERSRTRTDRLAAERIRAITELTDGLIEQAEALKREADSLIDAFAEANAEVIDLEGEDLGPADEAPAPAEPEASEPARPQEEVVGPRPQVSPLKAVSAPRASSPGSRPPRSVGTRLLVTQMALSGSSRREIEARLRNELGVEDTSQVVDAILGPED